MAFEGNGEELVGAEWRQTGKGLGCRSCRRVANALGVWVSEKEIKRVFLRGEAVKGLHRNYQAWFRKVPSSYCAVEDLFNPGATQGGKFSLSLLCHSLSEHSLSSNCTPDTVLNGTEVRHSKQ